METADESFGEATSGILNDWTAAAGRARPEKRAIPEAGGGKIRGIYIKGRKRWCIFAEKITPDDTDMVLIERIKLQHVRNIPPMEIPLSATERKHLIITGPNGSGKTTLINDLKAFFRQMGKDVADFYKYALKESSAARYEEIFDAPKGKTYRNVIEERRLQLQEKANAAVCLTDAERFYPEYLRGDFIICSFDAHRKVDFIEPKGPVKIEVQNTLEENVGRFFVQMLVNFRARRSFANDEGNQELVKRINDWFQRFEKALSVLLGHDRFRLVFDSVDFNFTIEEEGKEPYHFSQLSDGYSALLSIVSELMLRMGWEDPLPAYDKPGIVLIDEVENHLHVELQRKVLPFLTEFFPNIQFIVTTHSPFVITSVKNSVLFDMGKRIYYNDLNLSDYSYASVIEDYYGVSSYSDTLLEMVRELERTLDQPQLSEGEKRHVKEIYDSVSRLPERQIVSPELRVRVNDLILKNISKLHGIF